MANSENLGKVLITIAVFLAFFTVIGAMVAPASYLAHVAEDVENNTNLQGQIDPQILAEYIFWYKHGESQPGGYAVNNTIKGTYWQHIAWHWIDTNAPALRFDQPNSNEHVELYLINPNVMYNPNYPEEYYKYPQFWVIYRQWGLWSEKYVVIPFSEIIENIKPGLNYVKLTKDLGGPITVMFRFNSTNPDTIQYYLNYNTNYTVYAGQGILDAAQSSANGWNFIAALLTFQMPNIHPLLNFFIAFPIWLGIIYVCYRLILLAIPFVGG